MFSGKLANNSDQSYASGDSRRWAAVLGPLGIVWLVIVFADLAFGCFVSGSAVRGAHLTASGWCGILCANATVVAAMVILVGAPWLSATIGPADKGKRRSSVGWKALSTFVLFTCVMLYLASWAVFWDTGQFLDRNAVTMIRADWLGMFQHALHMRPLATLLGPLVALLAVITATTVLPRWSAVRRVATHPATVAAIGCLALLATAGAFLGELMSGRSSAPCVDTDTGIRYRQCDLYATSRDDRTGPLAHGLADLRRTLCSRWSSGPLSMPDLESLDRAEDIQITHRPQVSIDDYLETVDRGQLKRHNVIVLLVESLRPDQLRSFGGLRDVMPHVDAVAAQAGIFTNAYTQASHSNYADMSPLSSHYPLREQGIHVYPSRPRYPRVMIYDVLKALGYHTAVISSQNEHWGQMLNYLDTGNLDHILHAANYSGPTYVCDGDTGFSTWAQGGKKSGKIDDRITVNQAIQWMGGRRGEPFFAYINLQNSHIPYVTPPDFARRFSPKKIGFTIGFNNYPPNKTSVVKDVYADSLAYVDAQIARLIDYLKQSNQWDRTILVVTGDTGQAFYEHGFAAHANKLYNEVMRVPLIVHAPGLTPGRDGRPCQHVDVPPTVFGLLGLPPHPSFQGVDLFASDPTDERSIYLVAQTPLATQVALVRSNYKLFFDSPYQRFHLYDLQADPGERLDVADTHPEITGAMAVRLRRWCAAQLEYYGSAELCRETD